jgi:hypothetical protein
MKHRLLLLTCLLVSFFSSAQKQDRIWCFGSNSGIDFNDSLNPVPFTSNLPQNAMYSYASIADNGGSLLFYVAGIRWDTLGARIWNRNFQTMQNGDSIRGQPNRAQPFVIIPFPEDSNKYYLFSWSYITYRTALHYSVIDMQANGGLGAVVQKNAFLLRDTLCEKMTAVRHGNGRDWWLLLRRYWSNTFYKYLITDLGIIGPYLQDIGTYPGTYYGEMEFSLDGNKLVMVSTEACIDIMDFDRCTGLLSNYVDAGEHGAWNPATSYYGCAFSPDKTKLYVTTETSLNDRKWIYQYDLTAANVMSSKQTVWTYDTLSFWLGQMQLAPDGKIYVAKGNAYNSFENTVYDQNLDYITYPDSLGTACGYCSNCFSLQGNGISELGLPNMPNYNLGALVGSPCDTLTTNINNQASINNGSTSSPTSQLFVFYHSGWQTAFINAKELRGKKVEVMVYDEMGRAVYPTPALPKWGGSTSGGYFTLDLDCKDFAAGVYIVVLQTEEERLVKRFVKE